jgi:hypothetical protein
VRLNLAMALLRLGSYHEGLPLYEARLDKTTWSGFATLESRTALRHRLLGPGEPVDGRRILLLAEQGLGDSIMCARYIPLLARRGARIIVASNPTLAPFWRVFPASRPCCRRLPTSRWRRSTSRRCRSTHGCRG